MTDVTQWEDALMTRWQIIFAEFQNEPGPLEVRMENGKLLRVNQGVLYIGTKMLGAAKLEDRVNALYLVPELRRLKGSAASMSSQIEKAIQHFDKEQQT